jgi:hypothetical protein
MVVRGPRVVVVAVVATLSFASAPAAVGAPAVQWERQAGVRLEAVASVPGGGAVVTGSLVRSGTFHAALLVRRYGGEGKLIWSRTWQPTGTRVRGLDVALGPDGSVYVVGDIARHNLEGGGFFVRKYGPMGGVRWTRITPGGYVHGMGLPEVATGVAVRRDVVVVVGNHYECCGAVGDDGWVRAYRPNGGLRWFRDFEVPGVATATNDALEAVAVGAGGVYVAGRVEMAPRGDVAVRVDHELVVQRLSLGGARGWTWMLRDSGVRDEDTATGIALRDGRLYVTGRVNGAWWTSSGWLGRLTTDGRTLWQRTWGRAKDGFRSWDVAITPGHAAVVTGSRRSLGDRGTVLFLRKVASGGRLLTKALVDDPFMVEGSGVSALRGGAHVAGWMGEKAADRTVGVLWRWRI